MQSPRTHQYGSVPKLMNLAINEDDFILLGARYEGSDHTKLKKTSCQDSFEFGVSDSIIWIAVADGLSAHTHAQYGSRYACEAIAEFIHSHKQLPTGDDAVKLGNQALNYCRNKLTQIANFWGVKPIRFATTLQVTFIDRYSNHAIHCAIGDGITIATLKDNSSSVIEYNRAKPPNGGTAHLMMHEAEKFFAVKEIQEEIKIFTTVTDGMEEVFIDIQNRNPDETVDAVFIDYLLEITSKNKHNEPDQCHDLNQLIFKSNVIYDSGDDKTIVVFKRELMPKTRLEPKSKPKKVQTEAVSVKPPDISPPKKTPEARKPETEDFFWLGFNLISLLVLTFWLLW